MKTTNTLKAFFLVLCGAVLTGGCGGSGGGNAENRPPIPDPLLTLTGVVSVRVSAVPPGPRSASLEAESPVPQAAISFYLEGRSTPSTQTISDAQGRYTLNIPLGSQGLVRVAKDNRQLSAIVLNKRAVNGVIQRDVNLESSVVEIALRNQNKLSYDVEAMEEQVRIGESPALLDEVKAAYLAGRPPAPSEAAVQDGRIRLLSGEESATKDCLTGQEWCLVFSRLEAGATAGTYTSRLLLRRDRTEGSNADTSTATVGAGDLMLRLPAGLNLTSLSGSLAAGGEVIIDEGPAEEDGLIPIAFIHDTDDGIGEALKLADLTFTATRTLTADDRLVVTTQELVGVLNESRAGGTQTVP